MALAVLDFPFHTYEWDYEDNSLHVSFGGGWEFSSTPPAPPVRRITLSFSGMQDPTAATASTPDVTTLPQMNINTLEAFYRVHQQYDKFVYINPTLGTLNVRFSKPFKRPKLIRGGNGVVEDFSIELLEMLQ